MGNETFVEWFVRKCMCEQAQELRERIETLEAALRLIRDFVNERSELREIASKALNSEG